MESIKCYICNSSSQDIILKSNNNIYNEIFSIVKCECGFKFLNPRPTEEEIGSYYNKGDYHPHSRSKGLFFTLYLLSRKLTFWWKFKTIRRLANNDIIHLDYGSGDGSFVKYMRKKGYDSIGYDPW